MEQSTFGFIKEGEVIRKAFADFTDRVVGKVEDSEEKSLQYFQEQFQKLEAEVKDIADKIEQNANKGSFKTKVENLLTALPEYDGIGDFQSLHNQLAELLNDLEEYVVQNRNKNLQIKTALLEQLRPFAESHEWKMANGAIKEIQQKWVKTGAVDLDKREAIEGEFKTLISSFYERRNAFYADLNQMMEEKEQDFVAFVEQAKSLLEIKELQKLRAEIKMKKAEWQALGKINPTKHTEFWNQFQEIIKQALAESKKQDKTKKKLSDKDLVAEAQKILEKIKEDRAKSHKIDTKALRGLWRSLGKSAQAEFKTLSQEFHHLVDLIDEKTFIDSLVQKKKGKGDRDELSLTIKVCRDLLERDKRELINFEENLGKFNMTSGLDNMLTKKLEQQKRKVDVKETILKELKKQREKK